jgi:hypothetical protein
MFCIKICNPEGSNESGFCQHTLDRIGLGYNCPSKYTIGGGFADGDFEVCDTDDMTVPGVYTDASGATQSYAQPPESDGPITTLPYQPTVVASRNCVQTASSALFTELAAAPSGSASASASGSGSPSGSATGTASNSGVTAKPTGTGTAVASNKSGTSAGSNASASASAKSGAGHVAVVGTALSIVAAGAAFIALI